MTNPAWNRRQLTALALGAPLGLSLFRRAEAIQVGPAVTYQYRPQHAVVEDREAQTAAELGADRYRHITAQVTVNGQGPFTFLVDTGANRSAISTALAEQLGLPPGPPVRVTTVIGTRVRPTVLLDELRIGGRAQHGLHAPTLDFTGVAADGVLAVDWLKNRRVTFYFSEQRLEIVGSLVRTQFDAEIQQRTAVIIPAQLQSGQLSIINAQVGRTPLVALVDTGAQYTLGNPALRALVEKQLGPGVAAQRVGISTVTGERVDGDLMYLNSMRVGGVLFHNVAVVFADIRVFQLWNLDRQPAVVLGLGLLSAFDAVTLDYGRRQVRFDVAPGTARATTRRVEAKPATKGETL